MLTSHSRLNSGIEGEEVGLICDIFDDTDNFADFIRALAEAIDFLGSFLNIFTNEDHAFNRLTNRTLTAISITQGFLSCLGAKLRIARHILNEDSQGLDSFGSLRNL